MYDGFFVTARGESHRENGLPCQDAALFTRYNNGGITAAEDGHGSEKHFRSDTGAKVAVEVARKAIEEFSGLLRKETGDKPLDDSRMEAQLRQVERTIITRWRAEVLRDFAARPLDDAEQVLCAKHGLDLNDDNDRVRVYGTTLLAALLRVKLWFVIQIGDGKAVVLDEAGEPSFPPALEDDSLGFGKTTSLCDSNASENFRRAWGFNAIRGLTVATDGVSDSFVPEAYLAFHRKLYADFFADTARAKASLEKGVAKWSENGSRDDASLAGVFYTPDHGLRGAFRRLLTG